MLDKLLRMRGILAEMEDSALRMAQEANGEDRTDLERLTVALNDGLVTLYLGRLITRLERERAAK